MPALLAGLTLPTGMTMPPAMQLGADAGAPPPGQTSYPGRPDSVGHVDWDEIPVRCHWDDADFETYCDQAKDYMLDVWEAQVENLPWPTPFGDDGWGGDDRTDIYFSKDGAYGAYTICDYPDGWNFTDADPSDGRAGCAAHLVIDPNALDNDLDGYLAHEFNHILQFATDYNEPSLPPWEGAAVQAEEQTWAGRGSWKQYGRSYQNSPFAGLLNDGYELNATYSIYSYYEYGSAIWLMHLTSGYGISTTDLWFAGSDEGNENTTTVWDALWELTGDADAYLMDLELARALIGTDDAPAYYDGFDSGIEIQDTITEAGDYVPEYGPYNLGTVYVDVEIDDEVQLVVDSEHRSWGLVNVTDQQTTKLGGDLCTVFTGPARVGITTLGTTELNTNRNFHTLVEGETTFTLTRADDNSCYEPASGDTGAADTADTGGGGDGGGQGNKRPQDDEEPGGCGCAAASPAMFGWMVLPVLAARRRR